MEEMFALLRLLENPVAYREKLEALQKKADDAAATLAANEKLLDEIKVTRIEVFAARTESTSNLHNAKNLMSEAQKLKDVQDVRASELDTRDDMLRGKESAFAARESSLSVREREIVEREKESSATAARVAQKERDLDGRLAALKSIAA